MSTLSNIIGGSSKDRVVALNGPVNSGRSRVLLALAKEELALGKKVGVVITDVQPEWVGKSFSDVPNVKECFYLHDMSPRTRTVNAIRYMFSLGVDYLFFDKEISWQDLIQFDDELKSGKTIVYTSQLKRSQSGITSIEDLPISATQHTCLISKNDTDFILEWEFGDTVFNIEKTVA